MVPDIRIKPEEKAVGKKLQSKPINKKYLIKYGSVTDRINNKWYDAMDRLL